MHMSRSVYKSKSVSLCACTGQICEYVLYVFISLHNLESSSLCFSPKDLPA